MDFLEYFKIGAQKVYPINEETTVIQADPGRSIWRVAKALRISAYADSKDVRMPDGSDSKGISTASGSGNPSTS